MIASAPDYVHGYDARESRRLAEQADALRELVHAGIAYPHGSLVLEIGCGTAAQTVTLSRNSPGAHIVAVDRCARSLREAQVNVQTAGCTSIDFQQADIHALPFRPASFDHAFGCFVLEHVARPVDALTSVKRVMRPGATITLFEGDHGSVVLDPPSVRARAAIACQAELQRRAGGDATIGRRLAPILAAAGFTSICISPRVFHVRAGDGDGARSAERAFAPMIESVRERAIAAELIDGAEFDEGMTELRSTIRSGTLTYTFFKATATCP